MSLLTIVLGIFGLLSITSCVFRTEETQIEAYIVEVNIMESQLTSVLESLLIDNPVVYDDALAARSTKAQIGEGYTAYYIGALPHVEMAIQIIDQLDPPDDAAVFHELLTQWLEDTRQLMEDGPSAFQQFNETMIISILGRMAISSAKRDLLVIELDRITR